jgi:adenylate cyclase class IV
MSVENEQVLVPKLTEFETKYRVEPHLLTEFKKIMGELSGLHKFIYVEGPDYYFTTAVPTQFYEFAESLRNKEDKERLIKLIDGTLANLPSFLRYRRPSHGLDNGRSEITTKFKREGAKNNIQRKETNVRVDVTPEDSIRDFIGNFLYTTNFNIWKGCHIYNFDDATLVFYTVYDTTDGKATKSDSFVEIEVSEEKVSEMTEEQAWGIIAKYEKVLEDIGISPQKRLRKSLYEMYRREIK